MKKFFLFAYFTTVCILGHAISRKETKELVSNFNRVVQITETDYSMFQFRVTSLRRQEYEGMKAQTIKALRSGQQSWVDAVGSYVAWFQDPGFSVDGDSVSYEKWWSWAANKGRINYHQLIADYHPEFVCSRVEDETFFIRLGEGVNENLSKYAVACFKASGCKYLVIDMRGVESEDIYDPFTGLLFNQQVVHPGNMLRNTTGNRAMWEDFTKEGITTK